MEWLCCIGVTIAILIVLAANILSGIEDFLDSIPPLFWLIFWGIVLIVGLSFVGFAVVQEHLSSLPTVQNKIDEIETQLHAKKVSLRDAKQSFRRELMKHPWKADELLSAMENEKSELRKEPWFSDVKEKWDAWHYVLSTFPFEKIDRLFWDEKKVMTTDIGNQKFYSADLPGLKSIVDNIDSQSTDSNVLQLMKQTLIAIPRLSLASGEFPKLPTADELFNEYDPNKSESVLELVKNLCSKTIEKSNKDTNNFLKQNQYEAACYRQLEAIDLMIAEIKKLDNSFQETPLGLLNICRTEVVILLCRPHQEIVKANREKLTKADSSQVIELWEQTLDSLEDIQFIYPDFLKDKHLQKDIAELNKLLEFFEKDHKGSFSFIRKRMDPFIEIITNPKQKRSK